MSEIIAKEREVAVPGELLAKGMGAIPSNGTYREGDNIYASRTGLVSIDGKVIKILPLTGPYSPKRRDVIIGKVFDVLLSGWRIDLLTSPYSAVLGLKDGTTDFVSRGTDITKYYDIGDYVMCTITNVSSQKLVDVSTKGPGLRRLSEGRIIKVNSNKVPRIIGKQGSMVSMIKNATGCRILVGQNGVIWLSGEPDAEVIAVEAINMIEEQSHISGLTDKVKQFLEEKTGKNIDELMSQEKKARQEQEQNEQSEE